MDGGGDLKKCQTFDLLKIKKHQKEISDYMLKPSVRGLIGFHSTGSGKSISALTVARCLGLKTIIVMPGAVISGFKREISRTEEFVDLDIELTTYGVFINNFMDNHKLVTGKLVIVDEIHNFRSATSETYKMIYALSKAKKILLLSATPIQNEPSDLVGALCMLEATTINSEESAEKYYKAKLKKFNQALEEFEENNRVDDLKHLLTHKISTFQAKDPSIDVNYPTVRHKLVKINMTRDYYNEYYKIEKNIRTGLPKQFRTSKDLSAFFNGLRRASSHITKLSPKLKEIIKLIEISSLKKRKVVVYSAFQDSGIRLIKNELVKKNIKVVMVSGRESATQKGDSVSQYNSDKANVMLITQAAAAGIDLKGTRDLIIVEPHWNNSLLKQVYGRAARYQSHTHMPESKQNVKIYTFLLLKPESIRNKSLKKTSDSEINPESIDELVYKYAKNKDKRMHDFYKLLVKYSI